MKSNNLFSIVIDFKSKYFFSSLVLGIFVFTTCSLWGSLKSAIILSAVLILCGAVNLQVYNQKIAHTLQFIIFFGMSFLIVFLTQFIQDLILPIEIDKSYVSYDYYNIIMGMLFFGVFTVFLLFITLDTRISLLVPIFSLMLIAAINYYVFKFRGNELLPADIFSIHTAANVAAKYHFFVNPHMTYGWVLAIIVSIIFLKFVNQNRDVLKTQKTKRFLRSFWFIIFICLGVIFEIGLKDVKAHTFLNYGSIWNGSIVNLVKEFHEYSFAKKPDNYDTININNLENKYKSMNDSDEADAASEMPDLIVIMNESFADLNVLGNNYHTNIEVTPFINTLRDNTIKGYALSSIYGAGTPNSEYEFLTGNTLAFLPSGSIAYQQYIKDDTYSMVSYLKGIGYKCLSMHPYLSSGWARTTIYDYLHFDDSFYIDDFPQENLFRGYVSDQENFEQLIKNYESEKNNGQENVFFFNVTMQNHGGYGYSGENYEQTVSLEKYRDNYPDAEQYLTCIHETDKAVEFLIDYFQKSEHDVVIVFYGDHLPNLDNNFYEEIHSGRFQTLDEVQKKYMVPFFVWTNYESEEDVIELTSLNYLSNIMYKKAGIPLPAYNRFLEDVQVSIPAINSNGYYSINNGQFIDIGEAEGEEEEILNMYNQMEYNYIFDKNNKNSYFFGIDSVD